MNSINTYIIEKLKLNKNSEYEKIKYDSFFILFSKDKGKSIGIRNFGSYKAAMDFAEKEYFLDGYAYSFDDGDVFKNMNTLIHIKHASTTEIINYLDKLKERGEIIPIFDYEEYK